jgi:hypothetical protein
MIVEHQSTRIRDAQARFAAVKVAAEAAYPAVATFANTHRAEAYKAILKMLAVRDEQIVTSCIAECKTSFNGEPIQVYPMLHLPADTNEYGTWHRDGASHDMRVFWLPLTPYHYSGISYVAATDGAVSPLTSKVLSKFENIGRLEQPVTINADAFYSWPPRLLHRGNLNTSANLTSAMVIFMDPAGQSKAGALHPFTLAGITDTVRTIASSLTFGRDDNVTKFDGKALAALPADIVETFHAFFKLRTKFDLTAAV